MADDQAAALPCPGKRCHAGQPAKLAFCRCAVMFQSCKDDNAPRPQMHYLRRRKPPPPHLGLPLPRLSQDFMVGTSEIHRRKN